MGCEVTSAYNDEIVGKMGYSQRIVDDLLARDFRHAAPLPLPQFQSVKNIEGFGQSYATGKIFFTVVGQAECTVHVAGRFIVVQDLKSKKRRWIGNRDAVGAFDVREKLCLVGLSGGELVLWDLQFMEVKLQVLLPQGSLTAATVSLTSRYLFATDASQPNNMAFCYDIRTAKLKASAIVPSLQPALRGIPINEDTHATCCADGVWFMRMQKSGELRVTRGMFGHYPKTSMCCLAQAGNYLISGGVDGYIYAWRLATLRCTKAVRVHEGEVTAVAVKNGMVVLACSTGRVKIYSYKIAKNQKKAVVVEDEEEKVEDDDQILTFVLLDTYDKEGIIFSVAPSIKDPLLYYCQTRQGLLFQKRLPATDIAPSKKSLKAVESQDLVRMNGKAHHEWHGGKIFSVYMMNEKMLFLDIHSVQNGKLLLYEQRVAKLQCSCEGKFIACLPTTNQVAFLSKNSKVMAVETFGKVGEALLNADQSNFGQNSREVMALASGEQLLCINFTYHQQRCYLAVTTASNVHIFRREGRLTFEQQLSAKYEKEIPKMVDLGGHKMVFQEECMKWREQGESWRPISKEERERQQLLLCCSCKSTDSRWKTAGIVMGEGYAIFQK